MDLPEPTGNAVYDRNFFSVWVELQRLRGLFLVGKTGAPTVNDDSRTGVDVGALWVDETNNNSYQCQDSTVGAAVWAQID